MTAFDFFFFSLSLLLLLLPEYLLLSVIQAKDNMISHTGGAELNSESRGVKKITLKLHLNTVLKSGL